VHELARVANPVSSVTYGRLQAVGAHPGSIRRQFGATLMTMLLSSLTHPLAIDVSCTLAVIALLDRDGSLNALFKRLAGQPSVLQLGGLSALWWCAEVLQTLICYMRGGFRAHVNGGSHEHCNTNLPLGGWCIHWGLISEHVLLSEVNPAPCPLLQSQGHQCVLQCAHATPPHQDIRLGIGWDKTH